jgi:hypothetical protein
MLQVYVMVGQNSYFEVVKMSGAKSVICWYVIAELPLLSYASLLRIFGGKGGTGTRVALQILHFFKYHSTNSYFSFIHLPQTMCIVKYST